MKLRHALPLVAGLFAAAVTGVGLGWFAYGVGSAAEESPVVQVTSTAPAPAPSRPGLRPCPEEDSNDCIWLADQAGNGVGASFVALADGTVRYLAPKGWEPVGDTDLADALRDSGDAKDRKTRDWSVCWVHYADTTTIICPDGHMERS